MICPPVEHHTKSLLTISSISLGEVCAPLADQVLSEMVSELVRFSTAAVLRKNITEVFQFERPTCLYN